MTTFACGEVYRLPPETRDTGDKKARRHVVLCRVDTEQDPKRLVTVAYASTQSTPRVLGASFHEIDGSDSRNHWTGFREYTYVYPGIAITVSPDVVNDRVGAVGIAHWTRIKDRFRRALGLGTGIRGDRNAHHKTWRGVIVRVHDSVEEAFGFRFGVIVTEHGFSAATEWQTIVPVLDADAHEALASDVACDVSQSIGRADKGFAKGLLAVDILASVFHDKELAEVIGMVDQRTMNDIERSLIAHFNL